LALIGVLTTTAPIGNAMAARTTAHPANVEHLHAEGSDARHQLQLSNLHLTKSCSLLEKCCLVPTHFTTCTSNAAHPVPRSFLLSLYTHRAEQSLTWHRFLPAVLRRRGTQNLRQQPGCTSSGRADDKMTSCAGHKHADCAVCGAPCLRTGDMRIAAAEGQSTSRCGRHPPAKCRFVSCCTRG
jgi:hypothetical protein